jgi:hypothetical protein
MLILLPPKLAKLLVSDKFDSVDLEINSSRGSWSISVEAQLSEYGSDGFDDCYVEYCGSGESLALALHSIEEQLP